MNYPVTSQKHKWSAISHALISLGFCGFASSATAAVTLSFTNNVSPQDPYPSDGTLSGGYTAPFVTTIGKKNGFEFRMIEPANVPGGGFPDHKDIIDGTQQWIFGDDVNLTSVINTEMTGGSVTAGSAAPAGDVGLHNGALFFGNPFNFLAPTVGSDAGNFYGNGTINIDQVNNIITAFFPVLEAQWSSTHFPLGFLDDGANGVGITFTGPITNTSSSGGITTFDFVLAAEHIIQGGPNGGEDPGSAGFTKWTSQWELPGLGSAPDALFLIPGPPVANTGTLIPTPGSPAAGNKFNDGRIALTEAQTSPCGVEDPAEVTSACVGSCFDYTVTGIALASVQVVLPLTTPIPANAVLRKCDGSNWVNFVTSNGDTIESAPGATGDCSVPGSYVPGLQVGSFCVRTTIANGGLNDADGSSLDTQIVDPVGVAVSTVEIVNTALIPGEELGGCSLGGDRKQQPADWWLIAGLISLLGVYRKRLAGPPKDGLS